MKQRPVQKNKIAIYKRFACNIAILFLFLSFGCGLSVAQAEPVISKNYNPTYPVAASISAVEGAKPFEVIFSAEEVDITRFVPGTHVWSFGDGTIAEGNEVQHTYNMSGLFSPSVTVQFSNGHREVVPLAKISVLNEEIVIEAPTPTPTPTKTPIPTRTPTPEPTPEEVTTEETTTEEETPEQTTPEEEISEEKTPEETPTPTPTRTPTPVLTPTPIPTPDPTEGFFVQIIPNKANGPTPLQVRFTSKTEGGIPLSWKWDFGDGQKSTVEKPAHHFTSPGSYEVQLSVEFLGPVWVDAAPIIITLT